MNKSKKHSGFFIVFEGGEGSGKTTLANFLYRLFQDHHYDYPVILTKEPGGDGAICAKIRLILLDPTHKGKMSFRAELLLFEADRAQHVERVIKSALAQGITVISDRFEASTFAYQCIARGICTPAEFKIVNRLATGGLKPDFTFWIDVDPKIGLRRNVDAKKRDRFEMENLGFHRRLRQGFHKYFKALPKSKYLKLDGGLSLSVLKAIVSEEAIQRGWL